MLAQLIVREHNPKQGDVTHENPHYWPRCAGSGRAAACGRSPVPACGAATPAYAGALAAASEGFDVVRSDVEE
ncbi:MAG: hypothetical protein ACLSVD_11190 [Eggerthellaceae bacterium]